MDCSMPGFPVLHDLPEFAHVRVHGLLCWSSFNGVSLVLHLDTSYCFCMKAIKSQPFPAQMKSTPFASFPF